MALEKKKRPNVNHSRIRTCGQERCDAAVAVGVVPLFAVVGGEKSHTWRGLAPQLPGKTRNLVKLHVFSLARQKCQIWTKVVEEHDPGIIDKSGGGA